MKDETKLTHEIISALNQIPGVLCWRRNVGMKGRVRFGKKGQADIEGVVRGRHLEIEVKIDTELSTEQNDWLETMTKFGALAGMVHSIDEAISLISLPPPRP